MPKSDDAVTLESAKFRLDRLIAKGRVHMYKPIAVAEVLFHHRVNRTIDISNLEHYRRKSDKWCQEISQLIYGRRNVSNSRYWDQTFGPDVLPPSYLGVLAIENQEKNGIVEAYIYSHILDKSIGVAAIVRDVDQMSPEAFNLVAFLERFEKDVRFARSVDKAYEIVVYALFDVITKHLKARVTLSVQKDNSVLADFEDFAKMVLGVDRQQPEISQPARLYRVGTANAADTGLDMWANFGPAVQVKHITLSPTSAKEICDGLQSDQIVIVCKHAEAETIQSVLGQIGFGARIRGVLTEVELNRWYSLACGPKYRKTLGQDLLKAIVTELHLEFPLNRSEAISQLLTVRAYDFSKLIDGWSVRQSVARKSRNLRRS